MINNWYETFEELQHLNRDFYIDITEKEEASFRAEAKHITYNAYHGRNLKYVADPDNAGLSGYSKIKPEYRGDVLAFEGHAVDEVAYMDSVFEFEFYWLPAQNWGAMCTKRGRFTRVVYDRHDYEDILDYDSAIQHFFKDDVAPAYHEELVA